MLYNHAHLNMFTHNYSRNHSSFLSFAYFVTEIPLFGVLTSHDKADKEDSKKYEQTKREFIAMLGIPKTRFLCCTNYCDDYADQKDTELAQASFPELDIPVIKFMKEVS